MGEYLNQKYIPSPSDLVAEYYVEPEKGLSIEKVAEFLAAESSIGTWTDISTMSPEIAIRLRPSVCRVNKAKSTVKIAFHSELFEGGNMSQIYSAIAGNIFGMKAVKNLRLLDIQFPKKLAKSFKGPEFGVKGIRKIMKVKNRPLFGTIVKPKVGLNEVQHAKVAYNAWKGGLDIVKDDENLTSMVFNKFDKRIVETLAARDKAQLETGEMKMYMPNVTAETDEMIRRAEFVKDNGGEYIMIDILTAGFSALQTLRNLNLKTVIHAHRAGHAAFTRYPKHGISMLTLAKTARLIGVDQLHIGTVVGKMDGSKIDVTEIEDEMTQEFIPKGKNHALSQKWWDIKPVFPVASGGLHPGHLPSLVKIMGKDIIAQFGGGCHGHPEGTIAGAKAIRQAWDAIDNGKTLKAYSKKAPELAKALDKWS